MPDIRSWEEFRDVGGFWFVNLLLHVFGWSLSFDEEEDGTISQVYPRRTTWVGFDEKTNEEKQRAWLNHLMKK